ncbi:MAG TPA: hypothetical protein VFD32_24125 [Dehalococcoidia bacterium]|nr:hypothetical protein [Dehalococcoidia bacterium]
MNPWLRESSFILLAFAIWLVSVALPPSAVVEAAGALASAAHLPALAIQ